MKKIALVLFMVLALSGMAFAVDHATQEGEYFNNDSNQMDYFHVGDTLPGGASHWTFIPDIAGGGPGGNAYSKSKSYSKSYSKSSSYSKSTSSVGDITNISDPVQVFEPSITFEAPKIPKTVAVGTAPNMTDSELNFISPNERDVQTELPKFGCDIVKPIKASDCMVDVLWQSNDIKFKDLYKEVLKGLRSKEVQKYSAKAVRYQIREAASSKTWTTGGEVAANAVGMIGSAASGVTGGLVPKVGRSKSSNLYTVLFILVQEFK